MPPLMSSVAARLTFLDARPRDAARLAMVSVPQLAALALMAWSEEGPLRMAAFLCAWGMLNFFWLALLRRPALSAALSLPVVIVLVVISRFKFQVLVHDRELHRRDDHRFRHAGVPLARLSQGCDWLRSSPCWSAFPLAVLIWRLDPYPHAPAQLADGIDAACLGGADRRCRSPSPDAVRARPSATSTTCPGFARSGVDAVSAFLAHGFLESDPAVSDALRPLTVADACEPSASARTSCSSHDEGSFDIRDVNGIKVPDGYGPPLPLVRRQGAQIPGGGRRRAELVHRIQRDVGPCHRAPTAPFSSSSPASPPDGWSVDCRGRSRVAATALSRSIRCTAISWARARSITASALQTFPRRQGHRRPRVRAGPLLFRPCREA